LAALTARETTGRGQHLETTLVQALTPADYFGTMHWQAQLRRAAEPQSSQPAPPARAPALLCSKDGRWINTSMTMPHQLRAIVGARDRRAAAVERRQGGGRPVPRRVLRRVPAADARRVASHSAGGHRPCLRGSP